MKVLIIDSCDKCQFSVSKEINGIDDEVMFHCNHPEVKEHEPYCRKLKNVWTPPYFCPLPDYIPLEKTDSI